MAIVLLGVTFFMIGKADEGRRKLLECCDKVLLGALTKPENSATL